MRFLTVLLILVSGLVAQTVTPLTPAKLAELRSATLATEGVTAAQNALAEHSIKDLVVNRALANDQVDLFSDAIEVSGITNQKSSGRCWLFAGLNILRPRVMERYNLEQFEFSQNYLFFYDKLEKANLFLNHMIAWIDRPLDDREVDWLLRHPIGDGGQWNMVVDLVDKYGLVPMSAMPETYTSSHTHDLNVVLKRKLRQAAARMRAAHAAGEGVAALEAIHNETIAEVYRILVLTLGTPPESFEWRYADKKDRVSEPKTFTPVSFRDEAVDLDLGDYVYLLTDPTKQPFQNYAVTLDRDLVERPDMTVLNIPLELLKERTVATLTKDTPVWFACDVGKDQLRDEGLMVKGIFDYEALLGVDISISKADQIRYRESIPTHAMVFVGVDLQQGKAMQWRVENSWGTDNGKSGYWIMDDAWFDQNLYGVILPKRMLTKEILEARETEPIVVPPWDPMYALMIGPQ